MKYLIDIDGTLLNGSKAIAGAVGFIDKLNQEGRKYLLITNSIKSREVQKERLSNAGFNIESGKILTPITAINKYLFDMKIRRVKIIGSQSEIEQVNAENVIENYSM